MAARLTTLTQGCLDGAEANTVTFPEIVGALQAAGFESYAIDYRRSTAIYYLADGESVELPTHRSASMPAERLDVLALEAAIREAQRQAPGYTYLGFCEKAKAAGCAGYLVSFSGRRAVYFGRDGVVHTEHFPDS